jgi:hypothetical protein
MGVAHPTAGLSAIVKSRLGTGKETTMAEDWGLDVKKYAPNADQSVINGIVRHCGISLQRRDSSLVSLSDKQELARVREGFRSSA